MQETKVLKRVDGTRYEITARAYLQSFGTTGITYTVEVKVKQKGKRLWKNLPRGIYDFEYRKLSMGDRFKQVELNMFKYVTAEEVLDVKMELWKKFKPSK